MFLQSGTSSDLIAPKDFASDRKVERLFSFQTMLKVSACIEGGEAVGTTGDHASLMFTKSHSYSVNVLNVPAKHRAYFLGTTMMCFTTIDGMSSISKRNMVLELICNIFLCLRSDISKIRYCTSESCEYVFGNMLQENREFACSNFSNVVDKQNRRIKINFKLDTKVADEDLKSYQESFASFLEAALESEECQGPCEIDCT